MYIKSCIQDVHKYVDSTVHYPDDRWQHREKSRKLRDKSRKQDTMPIPSIQNNLNMQPKHKLGKNYCKDILNGPKRGVKVLTWATWAWMACSWARSSEWRLWAALLCSWRPARITLSCSSTSACLARWTPSASSNDLFSKDRNKYLQP